MNDLVDSTYKARSRVDPFAAILAKVSSRATSWNHPPFTQYTRHRRLT